MASLSMMPIKVVLTASILLCAATPPDTDTCSAHRGYPGVPGIPGSHGSNGNDGPRGEKGDPGDNGQRMGGPRGDLGPTGPPGRSGLKGEPGLQGLQGGEGAKGEKGSQTTTVSVSQKSFFSYKKTTSRTSPKDEPIKFEGSFIPDLPPEQAGDRLVDSMFQSKIKGLYFFTYHMTTRYPICLNIKKGAETMVGFCDSSEGHLVTSGSVVLELNTGDEVSLQPSESKAIRIEEGADSTFTGFLLFPIS